MGGWGTIGRRVRDNLADGSWRTAEEIAAGVGYSAPSLRALLRRHVDRGLLVRERETGSCYRYRLALLDDPLAGYPSAQAVRDAVAKLGPVTAPEVAAAVHLGISPVYGYLRTMAARGLVTASPGRPRLYTVPEEK